jgi:hypothetical protein
VSGRVAPWRVVLAFVILAGLIYFLALFSPIYFRNHQLQNYVSSLTRSSDAAGEPDTALRAAVVDKARQLNLPVAEDNVHLQRTADGLHIDVRYFVRVTMPLYTVDLHFYPGAGSR